MRRINSFPESDDDEDQEVRDASSESSIGSIPWADDAIKQNQLDWEEVEEALRCVNIKQLSLEQNLRDEILQWQEKFPQIIHESAGVGDKTYFSSSDTNKDDLFLDSDNFSNLSLSSLESNFDDDDSKTFTLDDLKAVKRNYSYNNFAHDFQNHKNTKPIVQTLELRQRPNTNYEKEILANRARNFDYTTTSPIITTRPTSKSIQKETLSSQILTSANFQRQRQMRMLPTINDVESTHNFSMQDNNKTTTSFVQLTQIKHVKTAPFSPTPSSGFKKLQMPRTLTNIPSAHNRNLVILPSINKSQIYNRNTPVPTGKRYFNPTTAATPATTATTFSTRSVQRTKMTPPTSSTTTTTSSARSNSALIQPNYKELRTFYFPHSASKLKSLK